MSKYLILSNSNELVRVFPERIVYIYSEGNYSTLVLADKEEHVFSFNLSSFEKIIEHQLGVDARLYIRLGKSLIINSEYIHYVNVSKQQIILSENLFMNKFILTASKEALKTLKWVLEENCKSRRTEK